MKILLFTLLLGVCLCHEDPITEPYSTEYIFQYIDHFNFLGSAGKNGQFKQRYLISGKYFYDN